MARKPSHLGSKRKPPSGGSSSVSLASIGSMGGAIGNGESDIPWLRVFRPASGKFFVLRSRAVVNDAKLRLGVSACLLGNEVRYDGGHKRNPFLTDLLGPFVEWVPICPEVEAGFGTPREAMHLVQDGPRGAPPHGAHAARRDQSARTGGRCPAAHDGRPQSRRLRAEKGLAVVRPLPREVVRRVGCGQTVGARAVCRRPRRRPAAAAARRRGTARRSAPARELHRARLRLSPAARARGRCRSAPAR